MYNYDYGIPEEDERCLSCEFYDTEVCNGCSIQQRQFLYKRKKRIGGHFQVTFEKLREMIGFRQDIVLRNISKDGPYENVYDIYIESDEPIDGVTRELREGEMPMESSFEKCLATISKVPVQVFFKGDKIELKPREEDDIYRDYICICADNEWAVFAPYFRLPDGAYRTIYDNIIVYSNNKEFVPRTALVNNKLRILE